MATMVMTVYGDDRAGLVDSIAEVVDLHGGSWEKSYMAELAGKFAGVVAITVPDSKVAGLLEGLEPLRAAGLDIDVHTVGSATLSPGARREVVLELTGHDHPGIVHDLSHALAERDISIAELATETTEAPMGGGTLFAARATLHVPERASMDDLEAMARHLADQLVVDIELTEVS